MRIKNELELAQHVRETKNVLLSYLTPDERRHRRRPGSEPDRTFEDVALEITTRPLGLDDRSTDVHRALESFQIAVGCLWIHAIEEGVVKRIAKGWMAKGGRRFRMDFEDVEAEVTFRIRHEIVNFDPGHGKSLFDYASKAIWTALAQWAASQALGVEVPKDAVHEVNASVRVAFEDTEPRQD